VTVELAPSGAPRPPIPETGTPGRYREIPTATDRPASWLRPGILWRSRNDPLARLHDPTDALREAWLEIQGVPAGSARADALRITGHEQAREPSFVVLGDTGEGDGSQTAVVPGLLVAGARADFTVICSDVIYPAGDAEDYPGKFFRPYADVAGPIYALPGNHDWYDRLSGFMAHFCGATRAPARRVGRGRGLRARVAHLLWRKERALDARAAARAAAPRPPDPRFPPQRASYWTLDAGPLRLVGIDTGIRGRIDARQGEWLVQVSRERPEATKVLLTGKPLIVDGCHDPCPIDWPPGHELAALATVDRVVREPAHGYAAAIGGDLHNYQRYPVRLGDGRTLQYVVNGGGGAFMHATHKIPRLGGEDGPAGVTEAETHFFPARAWSLHWLSGMLARGFLRPLALSPVEASAVVGRALGLEPLDPAARSLALRRLSPRLAAVQTLFFKPLPAPGRLFQRFASEILDSNDPPMAKSFVRLDVVGAELRLRCFRATGFLEDERAPTVEDRCSMPLRG
jgi:hypothetical protein